MSLNAKGAEIAILGFKDLVYMGVHVNPTIIYYYLYYYNTVKVLITAPKKIIQNRAWRSD